MSRGLLDTSALVAVNEGRLIDATILPRELSICVVTIAELHAGVHAASDTTVRTQRLQTLEAAASYEPLVVDAAAARHWARLRTLLAEAGRRAKVNDLWIASVAAANDLPVVTQDDDFEVIHSIGGPQVIKV